MADPSFATRIGRIISLRTRDLDALPYRDALLDLLDVYALHLAPLDQLDGAEWAQHDPAIVRAKQALEARFRAHLAAEAPEAPKARAAQRADDPVAQFRRVVREGLVPPVYDWLAERAGRAEVAEFLALEGGPDADFDDLVAVCQLGLAGTPKLTLARNYWDEMGTGDPSVVHTELHHDMVAALDLPHVSVTALPVPALERRALGGFLATNRARQPELLGSLGMLECQAGPRCRRVVHALRRVGAPTDALRFYEVHAVADPRHGKDWIDQAIVPLVERHPEWGPRIVRGAGWRAAVNRRFFASVAARFGVETGQAA